MNDKRKKFNKDLQEIIKKYNLESCDIFYEKSNEPTKLIYNKYGVKIYYNANYKYIDIIKGSEYYYE